MVSNEIAERINFKQTRERIKALEQEVLAWKERRESLLRSVGDPSGWFEKNKQLRCDNEKLEVALRSCWESNAELRSTILDMDRQLVTFKKNSKKSKAPQRAARKKPLGKAGTGAGDLELVYL